ncbi:ABC transporter substrate-binding protein [Rhodococcoides kyotonense]|uniref:Iron complex transport system substrate-binding protein n=1 Tax=Rhodococcoides kyotonense TaxID=398843 RepID=A0A239L6E6_9NOCA|nr:ABC transporter substrate-binding protein [Rhodococcus kyotonensis]SNT25905.1 iron complex transport system substrate-binding protein [Rhodococcus kyotonensis]
MTTKTIDDEFARIVGSLSRRGFLTGAAALAGVGLLSACSGQSSEAATEDMVEIEVDGEKYRIPRDPKRVVVVEARGGLDFALLAGYPIVASNWDEKSHLMTMVPEGTAKLGGTNNEPNAEAILSHEPDLLVVGEGWWKYYQEHSLLGTDIAPVLVVGMGATDSQWKQAMIDQLTALERKDVADEVMADYNAQIAASKERIGGLLDGKTVIVAGVDDGQFWIQRETFVTSVMRDLGLNVVTMAPRGPTDTDYATFYGLEDLDVFDQADFILLQNIDAPDTQSATWKRVRAVQAGHVGELPYDLNSGLALTATALAADLAEKVQVMR